MSDVSKFYINSISLENKVDKIEDELSYQLYNLGDSSRDDEKVLACKLMLNLDYKNDIISFDTFSFYVVDWFELRSEANNFKKWLDHFYIDYRIKI